MGADAVAEIKNACCSTWQHPAARLLLGDHLHPGGRALTEQTIKATFAGPGDVVLDMGCGNGASLGLLQQRGVLAVGVDLSEDAAKEAKGCGTALVADGERLPLAGGSIDSAIVECVLSLLPDKSGALRQLQRVIKPGGRLVISDVAIEGTLPFPLQGVTAWSCCIAGASSQHEYLDLVAGAGFAVEKVVNHSNALISTIGQVRRRLSLLEISATLGDVHLADLGVSGDALESARRVAAELLEQVREGVLGYIAIIAHRP